VLSFRQIKSVCFIGLLLASSQAFSVHARSTRRYTRHKRHHRLVVWHPLLRGSHESLLRQNEEIDRLGLPRIADDEQLEALVQQRELVPIQENRALRIHPDLAPENRYCKPWTLTFLNDLARDYYDEFHQPIQVNSAVRTAEQQQKLRRHNHNAAPDAGETASSHLAGLTVDISRRGMTRKQRKWIEQYLYGLRERGLVETAEERRQPVFHIMVAQRYTQLHEAPADTALQEAAEKTQQTATQ
jgi:hypothetical protein